MRVIPYFKNKTNFSYVLFAKNTPKARRKIKGPTMEKTDQAMSNQQEAKYSHINSKGEFRQKASLEIRKFAAEQ